MSKRTNDLRATAERAGRTEPTFDDTGAGLAMFVIFTTAVLIVTGAVALMALVGGWWLLGLAFAIHVLMTTIVVGTIALVIDGRAGTGADRSDAESRRPETADGSWISVPRRPAPRWPPTTAVPAPRRRSGDPFAPACGA